MMNLPTNSSILDLSQRIPTNSIVFIDNWTTTNSSSCSYSDAIENEFPKKNESIQDFHIESSLTDQYENLPIPNDLLSDNNPKENQSKLDFYSSIKNLPCSTSRIIIHDIQPCSNSSPYCSSNFLWSKYLSLIHERSISDAFFDHYLSSIHSKFEINMKLEYCYDLQHDLYWLTQIQLISHCLIYLHYIGIPDDDTTNDFWANIYDQRCHPIGWCKENSKLMFPPPILKKKTTQQTIKPILNHDFDKHDHEQLQTPPNYLFNKDIGLNPIEQFKVGMILEIQDINRPWTLWFVRIINSKGGRLHLRYMINSTTEDLTSDIHLFYLDWRVHLIGWTKDNSSIYSYRLPTYLSLINIDQQELIDFCYDYSQKNQYLPQTIFQDQEQIRQHCFQQGMKLEVFDIQTQNIYVGQIGEIYNEFYFEIQIDNENQTKFIGHATHPYILPINWAFEHRFALMKGKGIRQSDDYWTKYTNKLDLALERCFHFITLNSQGKTCIESGMKLEMILTLNNQDVVYSVTLIHIADHLMWLKTDQHINYYVLPINSLDIFPVGWAKFHRFEFFPPIDYQIEINTFEQNHDDLFSSITHHPRIYFNEIYQLTLFLNINCFAGPHICSSRLARLPSQFGPGPYQYVLNDMFHYFLSIISTSTNALRRLEYSLDSNFQTTFIKIAKRSSKYLRPISWPKDPRLISKYLRFLCTQFQACSNLISLKSYEHICPDKCHILMNTFGKDNKIKHKRIQTRSVLNRPRKQKSLLGLLKTNAISTSANEPILPGSDRKTRGFRVHIEPRTHTITRTNRKQKVRDNHERIDESRLDKTSDRKSVEIKTKKKRRTSPILNHVSSATTDLVLPKIETSPLTYPIPLLNTQNPVTWNVNDVCSYLNQSGCSFALKTIQEQEIDGAALLLLDDLPKVQDLLEFKLGPAVKFCHVVEQLRTQVIDTFHSSPSLKTSSRLSTTNTS